MPVVLFTVSRALHLVRPEALLPMVPDPLPAHRLLVHVWGWLNWHLPWA